MARRYCTSCGTKLPGKLGHGTPAPGGKLLCGRPEVEKSVRRGEDMMLMRVKTPGCVR